MGNGVKRGRHTFLNTIGNCRGFALMRSANASKAFRKRRPKPPAWPSYQSCASISSTLAARMKTTVNATGNAVQVQPSTSSTSRRFAGRSRARPRAFKLRLLRSRQWKVIVIQAVPKLRNKRNPFGRRQADSLVGGEQFHSLRIRNYEGTGNGLVSAHWPSLTNLYHERRSTLQDLRILLKGLTVRWPLSADCRLAAK